MLRDRPRLPRRDLEMADVEIVRVGVPRSHADLRPDPGPPADGAGRLLDHPVLDDELFRHLVLDEHVGVVDLARGGPDQRLEARRGEAVPVSEQEVGPRCCRRRHQSLPGRGFVFDLQKPSHRTTGGFIDMRGEL